MGNVASKSVKSPPLKLILPSPNPKQKLFFESNARFIAYGGARGGGKSWAMRTKAVLLAFNYPGLRILLLRKTLPELRENHVIPLLALLGECAKYNSSEKTFIFPNKSRIRLGYLDKENDMFRYQGQEYDVIMFEEATHFSWEQVRFLMLSCRSTRTDFTPRMYFTANPGGVGHQWFKRLFIDRHYLPGEDPSDYVFIPATIDDNKVLLQKDPGYLKMLDSLPEKMRRAFRMGDWGGFDGQFFEEFRDNPAGYKTRRNTHVIEPFDIPGSWTVYRSFDWGYAKPFSCGWWAVDFDSRLYRIAEYYGCNGTPNCGVKKHPDEVFAEIANIEKTHRYLASRHITGVADPSIWDCSRGESIAETAARHRIYFDPGDNTRIPGWMQVHYRLAFNDEGEPSMYFFNTCAHAIRTLPMMQYDSSRPEDLDTSLEDHIADEVRYMCMARPIKPRREAPKLILRDDPLNLLN
ncbi:MAG: Terminase-like family protein [Clostridiales bacterium]|nr:Terminase-like family protein [Clostridiales bacterium]